MREQFTKVEMEAAAIYTIGVRALAILTIGDHIRGGEQTSSGERERGFGRMVEIALDTATADA